MASDKIELAVRRELEAERLLGPVGVSLARGSYEALGINSLTEYVAVAYPGGLDELREERHRQETVRLARRRDSGRRQAALELADVLGVPRAQIEAELESQEREGL